MVLTPQNRRRFTASLAVGIALLAASNAAAQDVDNDRLIQKMAPAVEAQRTKIEQELKALDRAKLKADDWTKEWAGTYSTGDGLGMNVRIAVASKSGITYTWHGCLGLYDANHGEITDASQDGLTVNWVVDPAKSQYNFLSSKLFFVRWGPRRYLVPESKMLELVAQYNQGGYRREALFGMPLFFEGKPSSDLERDDPGPQGRPQLPQEYAKFIIEQPCRIKVSGIANVVRRKSAGDRPELVGGEIELGNGTDAGLQPGLLIEWDFRKYQTAQITLTGVEEKRSWGKFSTFLYNKSERLPEDTVIVFPGAKPDGESKP